MPQLHTYIEARLGRWSIWYHWGSRPGPRGVVSWYETIVMAPNVQGRGGDAGVCPVDEQEAGETHRVVMALPEDLRGVVFEAYLKGGTVQQKASALRCCPKTYYNRLDRAHTAALGYCNDIAAGIDLPVSKPMTVPLQTKRLTRLHSFRTFAGKLA